jgi:hypothetical protein
LTIPGSPEVATFVLLSEPAAQAFERGLSVSLDGVGEMAGGPDRI